MKRALADVTKLTRMVGTFVSTDGVRAVVDVGGGRIPADMAGYLPEINEPVWVLFIDGTALILGPTKMKPAEGTVTGPPSGNLVPISTVAGAMSVPYASGLTLSAGQVVKLGAWSGGGFVGAIMSTSPPPPLAPAPPSPGPVNQSAVFTAVDAGSYRSGWWTSQVWASDSNTGAWFYGSKIADTIPNGAAITAAAIYISATQITGWPPNIGYHSSAGKPGGNVSVGGASAVPVFNGWVNIPLSIVDYLKSNVGGVGVASGGYSIFRSLGQDPSSGALRINWTA
ncbi:hypothetical protein [Cryobacterium fucosi]|uniref:Uncharacterized protein n=1 Tax=Cryobacterium fucosi TaxID=1259157 RepID=A0A4R9B3J6_9MICO|nr:hypothetical protein [Cryobacterium fucosi]TFD74740.1 hypothetical protein E3T48_12505 [Cryobacterium fucosi]